MQYLCPTISWSSWILILNSQLKKNPAHGQVWISDKKKVPSGDPCFQQSFRMFILLDLEHLVQNGNLKLELHTLALRLALWACHCHIPLIQGTNGHLPSTFIQTTRRSVLLRGHALDFSGWTNHRVEYPCGRRQKNNLSFFSPNIVFFIWKRWEICLKVRVFWVVEPSLIFCQVYWGLYTTIDNLPAVSAVAISFWSLPQFGILAETPFCSCLSMSFFGPGYEYTSSHFELWWHSDTCQVLAGLILRIPHSRWSSRRSNQKEIQRHKIFRKPSSTWMLGLWRTAKELAPGGIETKRNRWELPTGTGRSATITLLDVAGLWEWKGWPGSCSTVFVLKESTHVWRICFLDISILDFCKVRNWSFHLPDFF